MIKRLSFVLACIFLISMVSAFEFDNTVTYDNQDLRATIHNAFNLPLFGSDIGTVELKSHKSVDEVKKVGVGNQVVMWYEFNFKDEYKDGLGIVEFKDMNTNKTISRTYEFVMLKDNEWIPYNSKDIPKGKVIIGLKTNVFISDYIDGVWTISGKKIDKHATWTSALNNNLLAYYNFNDISGNALDSLGISNGTVYGATQGVTGKIGTAYRFDGTNDEVIVNSSYMQVVNETNVSISMWVWSNKTSTTVYAISKSSDSAGRQNYAIRQENEWWNARTTQSNLGGIVANDSTTQVNTGAFQHVVYRRNDTYLSIWVNGVVAGIFAYDGTHYGQATNWTIGNRGDPSSAQFFNGTIDEIGIWNRSLTDAEITQLYNGGTGITYKNAPTIVLNEPVNLSTVTIPSVLFNSTGNSDGGTLANISLIVNGTYISTNSSPVSGAKTGILYVLLSPGLYNWSAEVCDTDDECVNSSANYLWYNNSVGITLNAPVNAYNSTSQSIVFNATGTDDTLLQNMSLIINATYNGTNSSVYNNTLTQFLRNLPDGFWNWTVEACDNVGSCTNATARNITIDSTNPLVNITAPLSLQGVHNAGQDEQLNWTATDSNIHTCWYEYNGVNTTVTCNVNTTTVTLTPGVTNVTMWVNDTVGNLASDTKNFYFKVFEIGRLGGNTTYETATNQFYVNTTGNSSLTSATFNWNGTAYSTKKSGTNFSTSFQVPAGVIPQNYFWNYTWGGSYVSSNTTIQEVNLTYFTNCNATYNVPFINYTAYDEGNQSQLNFSIPTSTFTYYLGNGTINKSLTYIQATEKLNYTFCATPSQSLNVDSRIQYESTSYPQRVYNPLVQIYNSVVNSTVLYLLISSNGQYVTLQVENPAGQLLSGVSSNVTRSISGVDTLVGSGTTGGAGTVTYFLDPDFIHTFGFLKTGYTTLITSFAPTQTTYTITLGGSTSTVSDYLRGITYAVGPTNSTLINNTSYPFQFNLTSTYWTVDLFGFSLTNSSGYEFASSSSTSNGGNLSVTLDTMLNDSITMNYYWHINNTFTNFSTTWIVLDSEGTGWSIFNFVTNVRAVVAGGIFGIGDFGIALIAFLTIFLTVGIVSYKFGFVNKAAIIVLSVGMIGLFDIGFGMFDGFVQKVFPLAFPGIVTVLMILIALGILFKGGTSG